MKRCLALMLIGMIWAGATRAPADTVILELQKSSDLRQWEVIPIDQFSLGAGGTILQSNADPAAHYRLRIRSDADAGYLTAIPLPQADPVAVDVAQRFLDEFPKGNAETGGSDPEGTWREVMLSPVCFPVYDPSYEKGNKPAYLQFKVVHKPLQKTDPAAEPFQVGAPNQADDHGDFGSILVSLTREDFPVVQFSDRGPASIEVLLRNSKGNGPIKALRFDDGFLAGEDAGGRLVGTLGNAPFQMDPNVLSLAGRPFEGRSSDQEPGHGSEDFPFEAKAFKSYEELKDDVVRNPLYQELRRQRAMQAKVFWDLHFGVEPTGILIGLNKPTTIYPQDRIKSAFVGDPNILSAEPGKDGTGLILIGLKQGGTAVQVDFADGRRETVIVSVGQSAQAGASLELATAGWTDWSYWYAGNWGDQRQYDQFYADPFMCPGGWSGCGPTAWSMLYGWWDLKGSRRCMANTALADAPLSNNSSVRDCDRYLFPRLGTFCVSGQAATLPWSMANGWQWGWARGAGFDISWTWGVPYISPWCIDRARESVQAGRPSIVGMGFYWHYPLAYGYAQREWRLLGITFATDRWFKCNMGWGGSSPEWRNSSSLWFATNGRYW